MSHVQLVIKSTDNPSKHTNHHFESFWPSLDLVPVFQKLYVKCNAQKWPRVSHLHENLRSFEFIYLCSSSFRKSRSVYPAWNLKSPWCLLKVMTFFWGKTFILWYNMRLTCLTVSVPSSALFTRSNITWNKTQIHTQVVKGTLDWEKHLTLDFKGISF